MKSKTNSPNTLQEAILYFSKTENCLEYLVARRWPNGVICPTCGREDVSFLEKQQKWQCKSAHTQRQFSAKVGTIFEDSPLGLDKWLMAVWMITACKNGVSSYEIHRAIGVTQKTAWFMLQRIRLAMQTGSFAKKMGGEGGHVEADETFIGGKARNMLERRFLFARCLASQFFVGHALICDLRYNFREAVTVVHVFAIVEAKGLLIEVTEKIETARH